MTVPFSCGTEFLDWLNHNCCQCAKGGDDGMGVGCDIAEALGGGPVPDDIARRMCLDRRYGKRGIYLQWRCGEFESRVAEEAEPRTRRFH